MSGLPFQGPDVLLMASAVAMGAAGSWHCALMCGPLCAALGPTSSPASGPTSGPASRPWSALLLGRATAYAATGALWAGAASTAGQFLIRGGAGPASPWLILWAMAHALVLSLGLWMVVTTRQPAWMGTARGGASTSGAVVRWVERGTAVQGGWGALGWGARGGLWVLLPCGLLQSAWVVASLASGAVAGAAIMAAFALASTPSLVAAPAVLGWLSRRGDGPVWRARLVRVSGLGLCMASAWALGHGLWVHVRDYC